MYEGGRRAFVNNWTFQVGLLWQDDEDWDQTQGPSEGAWSLEFGTRVRELEGV